MTVIEKAISETAAYHFKLFSVIVRERDDEWSLRSTSLSVTDEDDEVEVEEGRLTVSDKATAACCRLICGSTPLSMRCVRWQVSSGGRRERNDKIALRLGRHKQKKKRKMRKKRE